MLADYEGELKASLDKDADDALLCMLADVPGQVGDGGQKTLSYTLADGRTKTVTTHMGKAATPATLKRFLVGPKVIG